MRDTKCIRIGLALLFLLAPTLAGCVAVQPYAYDPYAVGPPPPVPPPPVYAAPGAVHVYQDVTLVFEPSWRGYAVRGHPHHYFRASYFYRWHRGGWERARRLRGPWGNVRAAALPHRLTTRHSPPRHREAKVRHAHEPRGERKVRHARESRSQRTPRVSHGGSERRRWARAVDPKEPPRQERTRKPEPKKRPDADDRAGSNRSRRADAKESRRADAKESRRAESRWAAHRRPWGRD